MKKKTKVLIFKKFPINFNTYDNPLFISCMLSFSEVVDIDIEDNGDGTVNIYYTVADAGDYTLSIKFGGQPIPEGFYTFTVSYYFFYIHQFSNRLLFVISFLFLFHTITD